MEKLTLIVFIALAAACGGNGDDIGGVDLADSTPPAVGFSAAVYQQGPTIEAGPEGSTRTINVRSRTAVLNMIASAKDSESGVQELRIWSSTSYTTCLGGTNLCTKHEPLVGDPLFYSNEPKRAEGEAARESASLLEPLDLSFLIPEGSREATIDLWAEGFNHANRKADTGVISVTWSR